MKAELDRRLVEAFPNLYADRYKGMRETCMCWGFDCGDGWYKILYDLSQKLEALGARATQVKEKYGTLRFYFTCPAATYDEAETAVDFAEVESLRTCEICGAPGKINEGPWFAVRCEKCVVR